MGTSQAQEEEQCYCNPGHSNSSLGTTVDDYTDTFPLHFLYRFALHTHARVVSTELQEAQKHAHFDAAILTSDPVLCGKC